MPMLLAQIPGFNEAIAQATKIDSESRDFAFLGLPTHICGVEVRLMTMRQYLRLSLLKNPFISGGRVKPADIGQILWLLSPFYVEPFAFGLSPARARVRMALATRRRREVMRSIAFIDFNQAKTELCDYVARMLQDSPGGSGGSIPVTSFVAVIIEMIAEAYGWPQETIGPDGLPVPHGGILDLPMPAIYQHIRRIVLLRNPKAAIIDQRTDAIKRKFLEKFMNPEPAPTAVPQPRRKRKK